jgi:carboxylate-amine ligase
MTAGTPGDAFSKRPADASDSLLTFGVEEEYQLVHPETRELRPRAGRMMKEAAVEHADDMQHELRLSQIETASQVCGTLGELREELGRLRGELIAAAERVGAELVAAGTHPFSHWEEQPFTPTRRYFELATDYQQLAREQVIFGCHVHVGVPSPEAAVHILNRARLWLAPLLALSASSPFWLGEDTGYDSYRTNLWIRWPLSGPPGWFASREAYDRLVADLAHCGIIEDASNVYWDLRLPPHLPTIEFRVADVCTTIDEAVMIAGLCRGLAMTALADEAAGVPAPDTRPELVRAIQWEAARYGLRGQLVDLRKLHCDDAETIIAALLEYVRPSLEAAGDWPEIERLVRTVLGDGNSATRQRRVLEEGGTLQDVVDHLRRETAKGALPRPGPS